MGVQVGKKPSLQQGVVGKVDPLHHVGWVEGTLLRLGKEIVYVTV